MKLPTNRILIALGGATLFAKTAGACAVCMGASDAPIAPAVNASIFMLLGVVLSVGGSFFYFLLYLAKRDGLPLTPEQELIRSLETAGPQQS